MYVKISWSELNLKQERLKLLKTHSIMLLVSCVFTPFVIQFHLQNNSLWSNAVNMHIFMISGSRLIRIDYLFWIHVTSGFNGFFSTVILTRSWWRRMLTNNPKPSNEWYYSDLKIQENRIKTEAVTVPSFYRKRWRPWRHQLC